LTKNLLSLQPFEIKLSGLASGTNEFHWRTGIELFENFENEEVLGADLNIDATIENSDGFADVQGRVTGSVTVLCDRCLEDVALPVDTEFDYEFDFAQAPVMDLSQTVYDFVMTALPLQRVHSDGQCNPDTVKFLSK